MSKNEYSYCLVVKNVNDKQQKICQEIFEDYKWESGLDVHKVIVDQLIGKNLVIQFVSHKNFDLDDDSIGKNIVHRLLGKDQFISNLYYTFEFDSAEAWFAVLGGASDKRDKENEVVYQIEFSKYGELQKTELSLEEIIKST